ncbi:uncharacterized protein OCT59_001796 [Rhizophagus irregularis]|uniref:uncharacterized protein n=1 Tax=Rhizophagus irregularis TaxID=588596 RepID=UPI00332199BA|nr:hypothetical protein OCT59_001796 [Rhizophagus irregularis]
MLETIQKFIFGRENELTKLMNRRHPFIFKGSKAAFKVKVGSFRSHCQAEEKNNFSIVIVKLPDVTYAEKLNLKMKSGSASLYSPYSIKLSKSGESIDETYYNLPTIRGPDSSIVFLKRWNTLTHSLGDSKEYCHEKRNKK